jgi:hypothetical protein
MDAVRHAFLSCFLPAISSRIRPAQHSSNEMASAMQAHTYRHRIPPRTVSGGVVQDTSPSTQLHGLLFFMYRVQTGWHPKETFAEVRSQPTRQHANESSEVVAPSARTSEMTAAFPYADVVGNSSKPGPRDDRSHVLNPEQRPTARVRRHSAEFKSLLASASASRQTGTSLPKQEGVLKMCWRMCLKWTQT